MATTRDLWTAAWRTVRRRMKGPCNEAAVLDKAQAELAGVRLSLDWQCTAGACWQDRRYGPAVASFKAARSKRFTALADLCRERWAAEELAETKLASERITFTEVPYTPRDTGKFRRAIGA